MSDRRTLGLSARLLLFIIPVCAGSLLATGFLTGWSAERGVKDAMFRLLEYKAEDLTRYADSQWELILENNLVDEPAYRESLRRSVRSYAATMLRGDGEWILAVDEDGRVQFSVGHYVSEEAVSAGLAGMVFDDAEDVYISGDFCGQDRVGVGFSLSSLGWRIFITDFHSSYFADIRFLRLNSIVMLGITVILSALFVILFIRYSLKPLKSVIADMEGIVKNRDFSRRVNPVQNDEVGELAREFNRMSDYLDRAMTRLRDAARQEAQARIEIRNRERETLEALGRVSDHKDPETARHTSRVGAYASLLSRLRGDSEEEADLMRWAVPLHDIGKVGIPDAILLKAEALNADERQVMESHVLIGHEILRDSASPILRAGADIAISHHERWDGSGYPQGLKGSDIPARGRITGLVDVFDALTTARPYKEAWSLDQAVEWVRDQKGKQFDPELTELFLEHIDDVRTILAEYADEETIESARDAALS